MANVYDGFISQERGMNGGFKAALIPESQYAKGINVICRGGSVQTRPPVTELGLVFEYAPDEVNFQKRKFQGSCVYHAEHASYLCCGVGGHVYLINLRTRAVRNVTLPVARFSQYVDRLHFCQVEKFLVVQDGINAALIVEDTNARQASFNDDEVPTGTIMAYGHGRLFVKVSDREFKAGDINKPNDPEAVLKFTEDTYLAGGGSFSLPATIGKITAMSFVRSFGTGTSHGPLLVFGNNGFASYHVYASRTTWQDADISKIEMIGNGAAGHASLVQMNEDIMYRSWSGMRSHTFLAYETKQKRAYTELSEEMRPFLDQETPWILPFVSAVSFAGRLLFTVVGQKVSALDEDDDAIDDYRFRGIASLDFAPRSGITAVSENMAAAWDGVWTGMNPTEIVAGIFDNTERCFIFGKTDEGVNVLYELGSGLPGLDNSDVPIACRLYTRGMSFKHFTDSGPRAIPYEQKKLSEVTLWIMGLEEDVSLAVAVRPDNRGVFSEIASKQLHAPICYGVNPPAGIPQVGRRQARPKFVFHAPREANDSYLKRSVLWGNYIEFCVEWRGFLEMLRFGAAAVMDENKAYSTEEPVTAMRFTDIEKGDFTYDLQRRVA